MSKQIELVGQRFLELALVAMSQKVQRKTVLKAIRPGAAILRLRLRQTTPVGPTGNLKRSIRSKTMRGMPPAIEVSISAPHVHLVHEGTKARMRKRIGGKFAYLNPHATAAQLSTGKGRANPFFARAKAKTDKQVVEVIQENLWHIIKMVAAYGAGAKLR